MFRTDRRVDDDGYIDEEGKNIDGKFDGSDGKNFENWFVGGCLYE
jgi:hypothetical protein